jgi:hypothetical protein
MANIITTLSQNNNVQIEFHGRQGKHVRLTPNDQNLKNKWTDWMLEINDFRDLIIPLQLNDVEYLIEKLLRGPNIITFSNINLNRQEYILSNDKKIVRRLDAGNVRNEYQTVALFVENNEGIWPPPSFELNRDEILALLRAMITLDSPNNYRVRDSLRNLQFLSAILWVKKENPDLLRGNKKPTANEIFRISLIK